MIGGSSSPNNFPVPLKWNAAIEHSHEGHCPLMIVFYHSVLDAHTVSFPPTTGDIASFPYPIVEIAYCPQRQTTMTNNFKKPSQAAQQLVLKMLDRDPVKRFKATQALDHPWIRRELGKIELGQPIVLTMDTVDAIADFRKRTPLQKATAMLMAACMSPDEIREMQDIFTRMDLNHHGSITYSELKACLNETLRTTVSPSFPPAETPVGVVVPGVSVSGGGSKQDLNEDLQCAV